MGSARGGEAQRRPDHARHHAGRPPGLLRLRRGEDPEPRRARAPAACSSRRPPSAAPLTLPAHSSIMTGMYPTYHGVRVNGSTALGEAQTTLAEALSREGLPDGGLHRRVRPRRALGAQPGLRRLRRPVRPEEVQAPRPRRRSSGPATRSWTRRWPGWRATSRIRSSPGSISTTRTPPTSRPSRFLSEFGGRGPGRPLRRRDRLRRPAGRPARRLAASRSGLDQKTVVVVVGRPRRGAGQPRRGDARLLRLRLRRPRAVHRGHAVRRAARRAGRFAGQPRSTSSRPCSRSRASTSPAEGPWPLAAAADAPPAGAGRGLRLRRVDDPEPAVRMERAPQPALDALQVHPGAAARALRPRRRTRARRRTSSTASRPWRAS